MLPFREKNIKDYGALGGENQWLLQFGTVTTTRKSSPGSRGYIDLTAKIN